MVNKERASNMLKIRDPLARLCVWATFRVAPLRCPLSLPAGKVNIENVKTM